MATYTVKECARAEVWGEGGQYGPKQAWNLVLVKEGIDYPCQANTKLEGDFPGMGETVEGSISTVNGREIFKRSYAGRAATTPVGAPQRSPQERDSIVRQHSQHMAIMWVAILQKLPQDPEHPWRPNYGTLKTVIDWFDRDAKGEPQP